MEVVRFGLASSSRCGCSSGLLPPASDVPSSSVPLPPLVRLGGIPAWSSRSFRLRTNGPRARRVFGIVSMVASRESLPSTSGPHDGEVREEEGEVIASSSSAFQLAASVASAVDAEKAASEKKRLDRAMRRKAQRSVYLWAAIASSVGFSTLAAGAVYYRFVWQMQGGGEVPYLEVLGTFSLAVGAAVGMEFWARWAHKALWHASLWHMHESHHRPREGPFELNDVFAIINAGPAIALLAYGFFNAGIVPGLCFGAGLGITMFGIAYMFIHDGLVHRRFPVGPIADVPYLQKVAAAHQLHHADLFKGVPYGLFLGPKELEEVGGSAELEALMQSKRKASKQAKSKPS